MLLQMTLFDSLMSNISLTMYMYQIFFIHSTVNGHLGYSQVLTTVNNIAMNSGVHVFCELELFLDICPGVDHMVLIKLFLIF